MSEGVELPWVGKYWGECCAVCGRNFSLYSFTARYHLGYNKYQVVTARFCTDHYSYGKQVTEIYRRASGWVIVNCY